MRKFLTASLTCCASFLCSAETINVDGFTVNVTTQTFVKADHEVKYCGDYVCLIDQRLPFGTDGKLPEIAVSRLAIKLGEQTVMLNTDDMFDPFEEPAELVDRLSIGVYWGDFYKVTGRFSDGAGAYIAHWIISPLGSSRLFLGSTELLDDLHAQVLE